MILNLDPQFNPYPSKSPVAFEAFTFNGGEPHLKIKSDLHQSDLVTVTHRIRSFQDFGFLLNAIDALRRMKVQQIELLLPYFPAARQDRVMEKGEALTVKIYTDILNALSLQRISIFDPHSDVTPALLDRVQVVSNHRFIAKVLEEIGSVVTLISPDGGALKKVYKLSTYLGGKEVIECSKIRNVQTGELSDFKIYSDDLDGKDCLIVDDICDGGRTFIGLAKELKSKNVGKLYLAISHGIFSNGLTELTQHFDKIFTTDSFKDITSAEGIIQIKLSDGLLPE